MLPIRILARGVLRGAVIASPLVAGARPLGAQVRADGAAPVLAAVRRLLDAMAARDTSAARAVLLPGAHFRAIPSDTTASAPRTEGDSAFLQRLASGHERLLERVWAPRVRVAGPLATVWAPYDFHIDGRRSHCGVDAFTMVRTGQGWQIGAIDYTVQRQGCAASPLGPPGAGRGAPGAAPP